MRKIVSLIIVMVILLVASTAYAALGDTINELTPGLATQAGYDSSVSDTTLSATIGQLLAAAMAFVGTAFLVLSVYAGILWMTAAGNDEQVSKAQKIFKASIIGLIIVISAYSITYFIAGLIGAAATGDGAVGGATATGFTDGFRNAARDSDLGDWLPGRW